MLRFASIAALFFSLNALGFTSVAHAADFYTDAAAMVNIIEVGEEQFTPASVRAKVGYTFAPRWSVEAHVGTNVYGDEEEQIEYEVRNISGLFVRYGTPADRRIRLYLSAGYSYAHLEITGPTGNRFEEYDDFSYAIGIEETLRSLKDLSVTVEYARYIDSSEDDIAISGATLGVRAAIKF
jgi:hypothetical protein